MSHSAVTSNSRLAALRNTGLLDTPPESAFDRVSRLTTRLLNVPVSLVSLVEADRQFFKSAIGLPEPWASSRETPLSHSFCQHLVPTGVPLVIEDARNDPLVCENLAIRDLGVIAYLGAPLITQTGFVLGSLCAIDSKPRKWTSDDIANLTEFAGIVMSEIALRQSEARLRLALTSANAGAWSWDSSAGLTDWSPECYELFGLDPRDGVPAYAEWRERCLHPADRQRVEREIGATLNSAVPEFKSEYRIVHPKRGVRWILARGRMERRAEKTTQILGLCVDITERKQAEEALQGSEARLSGIIAIAADAIISVDDEQCIVIFNEGAESVFGYGREEVMGQPLNILIPERFRNAHTRHAQEFGASKDAARHIGERLPIYALHKDGHEFAAEAAISSLRLDGKRILTVVLRDITERKRAEEKIRLLLGEVNHRTKNILNVVQAVARQTAASSGPKDFVPHFLERLRAVAASQDLLVRSQWQSVAIEALVRSQLEHLKGLLGGRIKLEGPPLGLTASAAQTLGMVLHELATNAGKYGALSNNTGQVEISWRLEPGGRFALSWTERGGPPVWAPARAGFGSTVIKIIPKADLDADVSLDYAWGGVAWRLECDAAAVLDGGG